MPLDLVMGLPEGEMNGEQNVDKFVQIMKDEAERCYEVARKQLQVTAERRKISYDIKVKKLNSKSEIGFGIGTREDIHEDRQNDNQCILDHS